MKLELILNGHKVQVEAGCDEFLVDVLRTHGCNSVRRGCETSNCGLCTVWLEGRPVLSCTLLAVRAAGKSITTLEGVGPEAGEFAGFLVNEGAEQCGFCSPGFIMTVLALKREIPNPTETDIINYLAGNLCRCTGYMGQLRAVKKYLGVQ
ncbi:MAG TPA: 2Fe-2S iron-sulfur cluster-binding protein [Bacillota bacterium]|nr:2Fe-2S iron-sulfur cluster-binding protein [Bacillota bacterium]